MVSSVPRLFLGIVLLMSACAPAAAPPTSAPAPQKAAPAAPAAPAASPAAPKAAEAKPAASPAAAPAAPAPAPAASPAAAPAAPAAPAASPAAKGPAPHEAVIEAARKEGKLVVWVTTPNLEPTHRELIDAFKKRFDLPNLEIEWLPIHQVDAASRVVAESKAGALGVDVVSGGPSTNGAPLAEGLISDTDWVGTFGTLLPGVKEAADRVQDAYKGKTIAHWDVIFVMGYNTDQIGREAVPVNLEDLADAKWQGKFAVNAQGGSPFDLLSLQLGTDPTVDLVRKLVENKAVLKSGSPAVVTTIVNGEVPLGLAYTSGVEAQKARGAPIAWKPFAKYTPVLPLDLYVPKGAPHPNAGRLFSAWLVTEGMKIQEEREFIGRASDPNSPIVAAINRENGGAPLLLPKTSDQQKLVDDARTKVGAVFSATQGR
jgi:ABC-type Fe3+ transport system substrate-binding protein